MSADVIERLRAADPAREIDPAPPEALLEQLKRGPRRVAPKRRRRALFLVPVAVAAAALSVLLIPGTHTNLAARAYAQTAPAGDRVLYVRTTIETHMRAPGVTKDTHAVRERWQQGDRWHQRTDLDGQVFTETRGRDGRLRFSDGSTAPPEYVARLAPDFIAEFRERYERGTLDEGATTTFNGRPARRYVIDEGRNRSEFFLDAETGSPLGSVERFAVGLTGSFAATTIVDALEQLPATAANEAKLNDPAATG